MIDYIQVRKDVLNAKAVGGMFEGSVHYFVLAKMKIVDKCKYGRKGWIGK